MFGESSQDARTSSRPVSRVQRRRLLGGLLRGVSRSFYLTLRVLPSSSRLPVGLAYLLAKAADTIADTRLLPPSRRLDNLLLFRDYLEGPMEIGALQKMEAELTDKQALPEERELLMSLPATFSLLKGLKEPDQSQVRKVVRNLTYGMEIDLTTFPPEDSGLLGCMEDAGALDEYIYHVAGCVGEFWTDITTASMSALDDRNRQRMAESFVALGKGLQLTNVLRDVSWDLRIGRCYLPRIDLTAIGMLPEDLLDPANGISAKTVLVAWVRVTLEYYVSAERYLLAIPRRYLRFRMAVLWPMLIGLATLTRLVRNERWLDPLYPTRVPRWRVYRMIALSWPCVYSNRILSAWIGRLRREVEDAL